MSGSELRARPGGCCERIAIEHVVRTPERRGVVVAKHDDGAARRVALDQLQYGNGIRAVADVIAEERVTGRAERVRVREARVDRLDVGMNIGEQSELQGGLVSRMRYPMPRVVTISTPAASSFLRNRCT